MTSESIEVLGSLAPRLPNFNSAAALIPIFQVLLLLRRAKAGIQTFRDERQDLKLSAVKRNKFSEFYQLKYSRLNIGHVCG